MTEMKTMLKQLARDTMFDISDDEMPALIEEYNMFMNHVQFLESIDTQDVEPLAFPYAVETTFLREDEVIHIISREDALKNAKSIQDYQIKVPKVVK